MTTRRDIIALGATAAILLLTKAIEAYGAQATVEIVAMTHSPVQTALKPVRDFLTKLGGQVKLVEIDSESSAGEKRIKAAGEKGHVPILLLINGSDKFKRPDGTRSCSRIFPPAPAIRSVSTAPGRSPISRRR